FESDRQRAKTALTMQIDSLDSSQIRKIAAFNARDGTGTPRKLRVAAYCRVSTDDIDQAISIHLQRTEYRKMIKSNPDWIFAGTYVDNGFSGTNTAHRPGFLKLIEDCRAGKIDMVITKTVSRFARNLMDCIKYVEELKTLNPPVNVYFEQEKLDTGLQTSGVILIVLAMVAEEESHMKSEAMLLSLEWRFSRGRFLTPALFGYDKVEVPDGFGGKKKTLVVNPQQAKVVEWMYAMLINGSTPEEIAGVLTELQIPTGGRRKDGTLNTNWTGNGIVALMRNERYCGDVLSRKTYTPNFKDHKAKKNRGKKNKYFQANHHEAIVPRRVWNAAQRILNSRRFGHEGEYLPMRIIDKGVLTGFISMNRSWAGFDTEDYYRAAQIAMGLLDDELDDDLDKEYLPDSGHRLAGLMDDHGISRIARELTEAEQRVKDELDGIDRSKQELEEQAETVRTFQVVSGEMFSHISEPVVRIGQKDILFNTSCIAKMRARYAEILFNPVERMIVVRPTEQSNPNAIEWGGKNRACSVLCRMLYESMGWDPEYTYRIPCQPIILKAPDKSIQQVLIFDLDNYIGRAVNKKEEIIQARREQEREEKLAEEAKSYFFPPDDDDEPEELVEIAEQVQKALELNKKIFGIPAFKHTSTFRSIDGSGTWEEWMAPARPLDTNHRYDAEVVDEMLRRIQEDPPELPTEQERMGDDIIDVTNVGEEDA
ncbi:MAG: recombinase family protein, partial [Oscillospiraceae bacterium]|nr:recombinase family protein [Oscillospiraceae bacterium]